MNDEPLVAHSLAEAYLYLKATPCASCGRGPLEASDAPPADAQDKEEGLTVTLTVTCGACQSAATWTFQLPEGVACPSRRRRPPPIPPSKGGRGGVGGATLDHATESESAVIVNPTDERSQIIDVGQWIVLFRMISEAAGGEADKSRARRLGIEAAQCLEEALKFYDELDNDLPPPEALFHNASRERFHRAPEQFSKRRLIELHSKLPITSTARSRQSVPKKKEWWRRTR